MKRMFSITVFALMAALLFIADAEATAYRYVKPSAFDRDAQLIISGKTRHYFVLEGDSEVEVTVKGPSKLKVMSRLVLIDAKATPSYTLRYHLDEAKKSRKISHRTKVSEKAEFKTGGDAAPAVLRSHVIEVPRGKHIYRFYLPEDSRDTIYTRFSLKTNEFTGGTPVVAMTPQEFGTAVDLVSREVYYRYYRVSGEDRVVIKLVGPVTLKVLTRIEYRQDMQGPQKWRVEVLEDGGTKRTYNLSASKSEINVYRNATDLVPSRAETFYVEVSEGEHVYEFMLPDNHRTAIFRFLLPKSQLDGK